MLNERRGWCGDITVTTRSPGGLEVVRFPNLITDDGLDLLRSALAGSDAEIKYVAVGSDSTAPTVSDSALGAEEFRKQVTSQTELGTGVVSTTAVLLSGDATGFTIAEIGWFGGVSATATPDSGVLVARVLYSRTKTSLETLQIDRTDTIGRA